MTTSITTRPTAAEFRAAAALVETTGAASYAALNRLRKDPETDDGEHARKEFERAFGLYSAAQKVMAILILAHHRPDLDLFAMTDLDHHELRLGVEVNGTTFVLATDDDQPNSPAWQLLTVKASDLARIPPEPAAV
jgi:hypothetical protein